MVYEHHTCDYCGRVFNTQSVKCPECGEVMRRATWTESSRYFEAERNRKASDGMDRRVGGLLGAIRGER